MSGQDPVRPGHIRPRTGQTRLCPAKNRSDPVISGQDPECPAKTRCDPVISGKEPVRAGYVRPRPGACIATPSFLLVPPHDIQSPIIGIAYRGQTFVSSRTLAHYESNPKGQAIVFVGDLYYADAYPCMIIVGRTHGQGNSTIFNFIVSYFRTKKAYSILTGASSAAVDYYVSMHTDVFISASPRNMHNAMLSSIQKLEDYQTKYGALQLFLNETMEWPEFQWAIQNAHKNRQGQVKGDTIHIYPSQYQIVCVNNISW
ncbi:hypothetical protein CTI12_AA068460 [Artemisia annua]|uniref:Uncharacterized protein n=1 Tax=Artemisia annua TaxID=35608 RepID=A0A2U1Q6Q1_ARTAN|nr:hypothetical protein CTI12_AA068460 [Artemisia annua]